MLNLAVYAEYGVPHLWLVDPLARTLETYMLEKERWTVAGLYKDEDQVSAAPFDQITLALNDLWTEA